MMGAISHGVKMKLQLEVDVTVPHAAPHRGSDATSHADPSPTASFNCLACMRV